LGIGTTDWWNYPQTITYLSPPEPDAPGANEQIDITLTAGVTYYFAIISEDFAANSSIFDNGADEGYAVNQATALAKPGEAPSAVTNLEGSIYTSASGAVKLTWTAPDEDKDALNGLPAQRYEVRYATYNIGGVVIG